MASPEHWILLDDDVPSWNRWRDENPDILPDLSNISLSRRHLESANLSRCNLIGTHLNNTDLRHCNFFRANLSNASLQGADLAGASCLEMHAFGANFAGASLAGAQIRNANMTNAHLSDATFDSAELCASDLSRTNLFQAKLRGVNLTDARLCWANLTRVDMCGANLRSSDLTGANFLEADLTEADLSFANLRFARFIDSRLDRANLSGCRVYGVSVWNVTSEGSAQSDLIITAPDEPTITVDDFAVAQFVYLLLTAGSIRKAIDTITSKVVLILGRFTPERAAILHSIREALRSRGYLPLLFDFAGPTTRDLTETISTLAHLARFVIADITDAKSIAQELTVIVPNLPSVPVLPLRLKSAEEYGMFEHFKRFPWVLETFAYRDHEDLSGNFDKRVIQPAEAAVKAQSAVSP